MISSDRVDGQTLTPHRDLSVWLEWQSSLSTDLSEPGKVKGQLWCGIETEHFERLGGPTSLEMRRIILGNKAEKW